MSRKQIETLVAAYSEKIGGDNAWCQVGVLRECLTELLSREISLSEFRERMVSVAITSSVTGSDKVS